MSVFWIERAVSRYAETLTALEDSAVAGQVTAEKVLSALWARDNVHASLAYGRATEDFDKTALISLDKRLKKLAAAVNEAIDLDDLRDSFQPADSAWWWSLDKLGTAQARTRLDWAWNGLTIVLLTIALSLVADISRRFLAEGSDPFSAMAVLTQGVVTLLAAGGTLTPAGRQAIDRLWASLRLPDHLRTGAKAATALLLLLLVLLLRLNLPQIAITYNNSGRVAHDRGELLTAQYNYQRAISLWPNNAAAHYNLGLLNEELWQLDEAKREYAIAVKGGLPHAYNNLARLYNLAEAPEKVVSLLQPEIIYGTDDLSVRYDMLKHLGWARLLQSRTGEAISTLGEAIELDPGQGAAHCLMAQVLEAEDMANSATEEWLACVAMIEGVLPEEDAWIGLAQERLP